ncbi:hypothetical protein ESA94_16085 [Lacibacter luteus]|uniref:DUF3810 family protein n=1 Tax=Lacibacter luteus TaxID=2508719 RepID=A0A4Q1CFU8_9BACT|nr:hypothetical protein [Lacibacter luteus]RXK58906.1 hypothetical protein ESA94_16085 [Lacibacter luteus]
MKLIQLTWRLILPLTIILFGLITKWWYVLPVDAPDTMMVGFPLAFAADGWHTSMSLQIFVLEFLFDFIIYFLFCFIIVFLFHHYWTKIKASKWLTGFLWTFSTIIIAIAVFIGSFSEQNFEIKRDWDRQILTTGFKLTWTHQDRPDFAKYDPNKK